VLGDRGQQGAHVGVLRITRGGRRWPWDDEVVAVVFSVVSQRRREGKKWRCERGKEEEGSRVSRGLKRGRGSRWCGVRWWCGGHGGGQRRGGGEEGREGERETCKLQRNKFLPIDKLFEHPSYLSLHKWSNIMSCPTRTVHIARVKKGKIPVSIFVFGVWGYI
jgi:hypothetical protein